MMVCPEKKETFTRHDESESERCQLLHSSSFAKPICRAPPPLPLTTRNNGRLHCDVTHFGQKWGRGVTRGPHAWARTATMSNNEDDNRNENVTSPEGKRDALVLECRPQPCSNCHPNGFPLSLSPSLCLRPNPLAEIRYGEVHCQSTDKGTPLH